jgi:hypothetical protein
MHSHANNQLQSYGTHHSAPEKPEALSSYKDVKYPFVVSLILLSEIKWYRLYCFFLCTRAKLDSNHSD